MRLVIIESPYAGDTQANVDYARRCMVDSLERGEAPFASHLLYTQCLNDKDEAERDWGIKAGYEWAMQARAAVFCLDRGWSPGMLAAFARYQDMELKCELRWLDKSDRTTEWHGGPGEQQ